MKKLHWLAILLVLLFSLINLYPSFYLGLWGDSWLSLLSYFALIPKNHFSWDKQISLLFAQYGAFFSIMGFLSKLIDYQSFYYYLLAYLLRLIASLSFYPLIFFLTRNFTASIFASLFFSITVIGFDATNWVFNMTVYLLITFFNLFLIFFIKYFQEGKKRQLFFASLFFVLAYSSAPVRATGFLPFIILIGIYLFKQSIYKKRFSRLIKSITLLIIIFIVLALIGSTQESNQGFTAWLKEGAATLLTEVEQKRFEFLLTPVITIGNIVIPDILTPAQTLNLATQFILILIINIVILKLDIFKGFNKIIVYLIFVAWTLLILFLGLSKNLIYSNTKYFIPLTAGGYFMIVSFFLIASLRKYQKIALPLIMSTALILTSLAASWWRTPLMPLNTSHRYMIVAAAGFTIFIAIILGLRRKLNSFLPLILSITLMILNIISTRTYLNQLLNNHSAEVSQKIWSQFPNISKFGKDYPLVFYFEGDNYNNSIIYENITFNFGPHICQIYSLQNQTSPYCRLKESFIPISVFAELVAITSNGSPLVAYGYPAKPLDINNIYAFRLEGRDKLIDITHQTREKLRENNSIPLNNN